MIKQFVVQVTFQVTEAVPVEAASAEEAVGKAIEAMDRSYRFVHADTDADGLTADMGSA